MRSRGTREPAKFGGEAPFFPRGAQGKERSGRFFFLFFLGSSLIPSQVGRSRLRLPVHRQNKNTRAGNPVATQVISRRDLNCAYFRANLAQLALGCPAGYRTICLCDCEGKKREIRRGLPLLPQAFRVNILCVFMCRHIFSKFKITNYFEVLVSSDKRVRT